MKDKIKKKLINGWWNFVETLLYICLLIGISIAGIIAFVVATSVIWVPTMLIIFAIKGII